MWFYCSKVVFQFVVLTTTKIHFNFLIFFDNFVWFMFNKHLNEMSKSDDPGSWVISLINEIM